MQSDLPLRSQVLNAVSTALVEHKIQDGEANQAAHASKQVWPSIHTNANRMHFDTDCIYFDTDKLMGGSHNDTIHTLTCVQTANIWSSNTVSLQ